MAVTQVYEVVHSSPLIQFVLDYIQDSDSPAYQYSSDPETFLTVKNDQGLTNREVIESTYNKIEAKKYAGKPTKGLFLKVGTKLVVEQQKVNRAGLLTQGIEVVSNNVPTFKAQQLALLESEDAYVPFNELKPVRGKVQTGVAKETFPDQTVWIWCRSLANKANNFQGEIFNLTPFVQHINTSVTKNGGNFQITLPPLVCENENGQWIIRRKSLQFYQNNKKTSLQGTGYIAEGSIFAAPLEQKNPDAASDNELVRNQFLFHNIIGTNDVVFIRFETLQTEADQRIQDEKGLFVSKINLPNRVYDMIGLVDLDDQAVNFQSNDVTITVGGRDLSKLLIDDGTYFYTLEISQGLLGGPGSAQNGGITQRLATDQALQYLSLYFNNSIDKVFEFVISQLSSIKVTPDDLFSAYGDRRNTKFKQIDDTEKFSKLDEDSKTLKAAAISEIKNIRKLVGLTQSAPIAETQTSTTVFNELKRFLRDIRTQKVRRVVGSLTDGWSAFKYVNEREVNESVDQDTLPEYFSENLFNLRETRVVTEARPTVQKIDQILDIEDSKTKFGDSFKRELMPGIWQIVKLVIDEQVLQRRIVDSSLSSANGPLLNFFRKVCQEPFVEFYMDTYGDMFYLTARKPPTDRVSILSELSAQVVTESTNGEKTTATIIDIEPEDVLFEDLSFSDNEVVSWYHLIPQANFSGDSEATSLTYLPAVYFPEYADIWGSRPLQIVHNYMTMMPKDPNANGLDVAQKQAVEDMKYLVESNAYLPFTRKGTIKINGDRRFKYGNLIRYKMTGEIFRVEGVRQDYVTSDSNVDRITTLDVCRGMVEQLIYGIPAIDDNGDTIDGYISYFNIINTNPIYEYSDVTSFTTSTVQVGTKKSSSFADQGLAPNTPFALASSASNIPDDQIVQQGNRNTQELDRYTEVCKKRFIQFINGINNLGYYVDITSGVRSRDEQFALYKDDSRNARPGHSKHETGLAMDINLINIKTGATVRKVDTLKTWLDTGVPQMAKVMGMNWGGSTWVNYYDPVHFEIIGTGGDQAIGDEEPVYEQRTTPVKSKSLDVAKIFSNFKVNGYVFNFFLKREQFSKQYLKAKSGYYTQDPQSTNAAKNLTAAVVTAKIRRK